MGLITFNGVSSDTLGLEITGRGVFNSPPKSYEMITIPHRNGDLILDNNRFENIDITYPAIFLPKSEYNGVTRTYSENKILVRQWLNSAKGYKVLTDSYNTDEYRLACFKEAIDINDYYFEAGEMDIIFNCRPERFLLSGNTPVAVQNQSQLTNAQAFASKPLIKVTGYGVLTITDSQTPTPNVYEINVMDHFDYVYIDCDSQVCYYGDTNANMYVVIDEFPVLSPGVNTITFPDTITNVEITPRWWRI